MVRLVQTVTPINDTNTISKWTETRFQMTHVTKEFDRAKVISKPMVHSAQTVHLSCIKISTISKQTKTSFQLGLVT
jgi:hypothetical protein